MAGRERQLDEVQALAAIFDGGVKATDPAVERWIEEGEAGFVGEQDTIALVVEIPLDAPASHGEGQGELPPQMLRCRLSCVLPPGYPASEPAACTADCEAWEAAEGAAVNTALAALCAAALAEGDEVLYDAAEHAKATAEASLASWSAARTAGAGVPLAALADAGPPSISRVFFWTHHTFRKQKLIYEWARALGVSGLVTVSKPGYTFVEAQPENMREFTKLNMAENWKEIRITWQEEGEERLFKDGLREVTIKQFVDEFRAMGREDVLEGTRNPHHRISKTTN